MLSNYIQTKDNVPSKCQLGKGKQEKKRKGTLKSLMPVHYLPFMFAWAWEWGQLTACFHKWTVWLV